MSTRSTIASSSEPGSIAECFDQLVAGHHGARPLSTYRLQFHCNFRFKDALELVSYFEKLGISHCYASPILKARAGSMHGYDITDHNTINPEVGTEQEFKEWLAQLKGHGMGLVLDTVPNHMGVGYGDNPWWQDILENGPASEYAGFFDIDWQPVKTELRNKVLIPILGNQYGAELESGRIRLNYENGYFLLLYYDKPLPIDPQTYSIIFEPLGDLREQQPSTGLRDEDRAELENILWDLRQLPPHTSATPEATAIRRARIPELRQKLQQLVNRSPGAKKLIDLAVDLCNGEAGNPRSFDPLHRLLEAQAYRLAHWRVSAQEINYRRFFDINDLVGLRMENPQVFAATHRLIRRLLADGLVDGIRLDHPDGLLNPLQYFTRVQMLYVASQCCGAEPSKPVAENGIENEIQDLFGQHDWGNRRVPLYVIVEKILEPGEDLPRNWPVDGTVGYEFTNLVNGIFIDRQNERFFTNLYRRITGNGSDVESLVYESKLLIMRTSLSSEVTVLTHLLEEIASTDRHARDFTRPALTDSIREVIASFPVYRTYIDERGNVSERDRAYITQAVALAKRRNPSTTGAIFDFLKNILLLNSPENAHIEAYRNRLNFTLKFQQLTGPVMAKGLEDTVCYVYNRFISVNEVGGSPGVFGVSLDDFHSGNKQRAQYWPNSLLATSTHDTKRSEDVRARLDVLSEMPRSWASQAMRWRRVNRGRKRGLPDGRLVPDANEEYLLYQTLVGAWPLEKMSKEGRQDFIRRIQAYMTKAVHEAKINLSWVNQNPDYVAALEQFIDRILRPGTPSRPNLFLAQVENFIPTVAFFGAINSITQALLKITVPGVPDIYQGTELWEFSLVDPDNRRPVDFTSRKLTLEQLERRAANGAPLTSLCEELISQFHDGRLKLWTIMRSLNFRREHPDLFQKGSYTPLHGTAHGRDHLIAFTREHDHECSVVAAPRLAYTFMKGQVGPPIGDAWGKSELIVNRSNTEYLNIFTGEVIRSSESRTLLCRELFGHFPVALLSAL